MAVGINSEDRFRSVWNGRLGLAALAGTVVLSGVGGFVAVRHAQRKPGAPKAGMVYVGQGFGGYKHAASVVKPGAAHGPSARRSVKPNTPPPAPLVMKADPVAPALARYEKGDFAGAEAAAGRVIAAGSAPGVSVADRRAAVRARDLTAFSKARTGDMVGARDEFARLRADAARLPDHGKPEGAVPLGVAPPPTFEENAAYQHAVCTAALGDKAGAEAEYVAFMRQYPDSPLLQASVKRIAKLHGGDVPKADEAVWRVAMNTAHAHELARERDVSLCGPECLAELERRLGNAHEVSALAAEMKTNEHGTALSDLEAAARRHGFPAAQGVALSRKGLSKQHLPVIALVSPGHYVLVDAAASSGGVRVWDPDGGGVGHGVSREVPARTWGGLWQGGVALALR